MTKERFRELVKKLHPDRWAGDRSALQAFRAVIAQRDRHEKRVNYCAKCGVAIDREAKHCNRHAREIWQKRQRRELTYGQT